MHLAENKHRQQQLHEPFKKEGPQQAAEVQLQPGCLLRHVPHPLQLHCTAQALQPPAQGLAMLSPAQGKSPPAQAASRRTGWLTKASCILVASAGMSLGPFTCTALSRSYAQQNNDLLCCCSSMQASTQCLRLGHASHCCSQSSND